MKNMQELIDFMVLSGVLKSAEIIKAFGQVDRKYFIPKELFSQLKPKGTLVIPIKNSIFRFEKISDSKISTQEFAGFVFVPLNL